MAVPAAFGAYMAEKRVLRTHLVTSPTHAHAIRATSNPMTVTTSATVAMDGTNSNVGVNVSTAKNNSSNDNNTDTKEQNDDNGNNSQSVHSIGVAMNQLSLSSSLPAASLPSPAFGIRPGNFPNIFYLSITPFVINVSCY
jgi:hypothetical protein